MSTPILTRKELNKLATLPRLHNAALEYKNKMVGKIFMYVFNNQFIEVSYNTDNFKHLTGVDSRLTPNQFYTNCIENTLTKEQIDFTHRHPYDLADKKLNHLMNLYSASSCECFMLKDITTNTATYKFGTTEMNFSIMLTEDLDFEGNKRSDYFIIKSLRDEDCFDKAADVFSVTHIFVKRNDEEKYSTLLYGDESRYDDLPAEVLSKLDESLKDTLSK